MQEYVLQCRAYLSSAISLTQISDISARLGLGSTSIRPFHCCCRYSVSPFRDFPYYSQMSPSSHDLTPPKVVAGKHVFIAAEHRPAAPDGKFRVVLVTSGSVASVKLPLIAAELIQVGQVLGILEGRRRRRSTALRCTEQSIVADIVDA